MVSSEADQSALIKDPHQALYRFDAQVTQYLDVEILAEPHGSPGLLHADRDLVFLEDVVEDDGRSQHVLIRRGATPIQNRRLQCAFIQPDVSVLRHDA